MILHTQGEGTETRPGHWGVRQMTEEEWEKVVSNARSREERYLGFPLPPAAEYRRTRLSAVREWLSNHFRTK